MNLKVRNIKKGYCEIWANERPGQRYECIAKVNRLDNGGWHWLATDYYILTEHNYVAQSTRRECIENCERYALMRLVECAIKRQARESQHWHSPRRDAWHDVSQFGWLFAHEELVEIKRRLTTFEEDE